MTLPRQIGRYRIDRELGRGGMGVVYAAYDDGLERHVAIKTVSGASAGEESRKRMRREARAGARIQHPNVCHIYEIGEDRGELFIAMQLLQGQSLAERLDRGPLSVAECLDVSLEILSALEALHREGLVHRDLKPSNIFLTPHGAKILDFGLALSTSSHLLDSQITESRITQQGAVVGTPPYMAPEQFRGEPVDARTDLFAMGAVVFEMLTASRAFPGATPVEVYHKTLYEPPQALGGSPAAMVVDRVVRRALAKSPQERYASASEMAEALRAARGLETTGQMRAYTMTRVMVLPFRMLRPDSDTDFLAVSIPDAVTGALSSIESLVVRSSALASGLTAPAADVSRIARDADVDVVLTGSVLRVGQQVRVTAQLVRASDGTILWSQAPQVTLRDMLQIQDEIVTHIVESLSLSLTAREQRKLKANVPSSPTAFEYFLRANQLTLQAGVASADNLSVARGLYERCLEEDARYAPAWARLGRCLWLIGKGGEDREENIRRAEQCFQKALELNAELPIGHNLYALVEIDQGGARDAMVRLVTSACAGGATPETFVALVQACRFCGLLKASVAAHQRARELDRHIVTPVEHTYWQLRDYDHVLEHVQRSARPSLINKLMVAVVAGERGQKDDALRRLREIETGDLTEFVRAMVASTRALYEGKREESLDRAQFVIDRFPDPETVCWHARILAHFGERARALDAMNLALDRGFNPYWILTRTDPWLDSMRSSREGEDLMQRSEARYLEALAAFRDAGGETLLGGDTA